MFPPLPKVTGKTVHGVEGWFVRTIMMIEILKQALASFHILILLGKL